MCIEKTCAEEFLAYTDKRVFLSNLQTARVKCYYWNVWMFFYSEKITPSKPKWSLRMNEQTHMNCRAFMSQSPTIFNFLPAGDHVPLRELAEGIVCLHFCCCRRALLWRWHSLSLPRTPGCSCGTSWDTDMSSFPAHPHAGEVTSAKAGVTAAGATSIHLQEPFLCAGKGFLQGMDIFFCNVFHISYYSDK